MKTRVSEHGQIAIPKRLRERLGIRPGDVLEVRAQDDAIVISKETGADPLRALTGIIEIDARTDDLVEALGGGADAVVERSWPTDGLPRSG